MNNMYSNNNNKQCETYRDAEFVLGFIIRLLSLSLLIPLDFFIFILFTRLRFESLSRVREIRKSCLYLYAVLSFFHNCKAFFGNVIHNFFPQSNKQGWPAAACKQSWQNACCRHNNGHFYHVCLMKYETSWQITAVDSKQSCRHNLKLCTLEIVTCQVGEVGVAGSSLRCNPTTIDQTQDIHLQNQFHGRPENNLTIKYWSFVISKIWV